MATFLKPKAKHLRQAFIDHGVRFIEADGVSDGRSEWANGLRSVVVHHTAGKNSLATLMRSWSLPGANVLINNGTYNGAAVDGRAVILSWGDCWHPGDGGPWKGVAGEDSLHLTAWGIEIESLGTKRDITPAQVETVGRILAALNSLGVPIGNVVRHADWTDATGGVTGPLRKRSNGRTTVGRKIDTRAEKGYTTAFWREHAERFVIPERTLVATPAKPKKGDSWDGVVPYFDVLMAAAESGDANKATWRLACRLRDLGHYGGQPVQGVQAYPAKAVAAWQRSRGYQPTGAWGPKAQKLLFGATS